MLMHLDLDLDLDLFILCELTTPLQVNYFKAHKIDPKERKKKRNLGCAAGGLVQWTFFTMFAQDDVEGQLNNEVQLIENIKDKLKVSKNGTNSMKLLKI